MRRRTVHRCRSTYRGVVVIGMRRSHAHTTGWPANAAIAGHNHSHGGDQSDGCEGPATGPDTDDAGDTVRTNRLDPSMAIYVAVSSFLVFLPFDSTSPASPHPGLSVHNFNASQGYPVCDKSTYSTLTAICRRHETMIRELAQLDFVTCANNLVFIGPTGVGKSGFRGLFIKAQDLFDQMYGSIADRSSRRLIDRFMNIDILLIDEMGYLNLQPQQSNLFFKLMDERYCRKSTLITTNLEYDRSHRSIALPRQVAGDLCR